MAKVVRHKQLGTVEHESETESVGPAKYYVDSRGAKHKCKQTSPKFSGRPMLLIFALLECGLVAVVVEAAVRKHVLSSGSALFFG